MIEALSLLPFCFFFAASGLTFDLGNWADPDPKPCPDEMGILLEEGSSMVDFEDCEDDDDESWEIMVNLGLVDE